MSRTEDLKWIEIKNFLGMDAPLNTISDLALSRDMVNMSIRSGRMFARPGAATFQNANHDEPVIGFFDFNHLGTVHLLRFSTKGIQEWSGTAWADLTLDVAIAAADGDNVDTVQYKDDLYTIPQPGVKPFKWTAASGTVTQISGAVTGRTLMNYSAYLMIGYANGDPRGIRYSIDASTWAAADVLTMVDTPGFIVRMLPYAGVGYIYKNFSTEFIKFVGSTATDFSQSVLDENIGLGAANTLVGTGHLGHIFLGHDGRLYLNNGSLQPILGKVSDRIIDEINFDEIGESFAAIDANNTIYTLFYPRGSSKYSFRRMDLNYRTGVVEVHSYELMDVGTFSRGFYTRYGEKPPFFIMSSAGGVPVTYRLDTTTQLTDNGTLLHPYWATDWIPTGQQHLLEIRFRIKHKGRGVMTVKLAEDIGNVYDTVAVKDFRDRVAGEDIFAIENMNSKVDHIKLRVELAPAVDNKDIEMQGIAFGFAPAEGSPG